jgi:hypothetical protein
LILGARRSPGFVVIRESFANGSKRSGHDLLAAPQYGSWRLRRRNLGPIANAEGQIDIQIRDLDQTVIGNPAPDLFRLGLSLATDARGSDLPAVTAAKMLEQLT